MGLDDEKLSNKNYYDYDEYFQTLTKTKVGRIENLYQSCVELIDL